MTGPFAVTTDDNLVTLAILETWERAVARKLQAQREHPTRHWKIVVAQKKSKR